MPEEGYVFHTYGGEAYLRHAVASLVTLRRHDEKRPVALYCPDAHKDILARRGLAHLFSQTASLPEAHWSIIGFKHYLHRFRPFARSLFVDSDMVWCRDPDPLWTQLSIYPFTATGLDRADIYFGGPKSVGVALDLLFDRRLRTLRTFGLSYLPRVQAGMIYSQDPAQTRRVCEAAADFHDRRLETHFRTRFQEGRSEESCEWGLAMAMSRYGLPIYPWYQGHNSPQLDYIEGLTEHTKDFEEVSCRYYSDRFIYDIRGLPNARVRDLCLRFFSTILRRRDYLMATPFALHFSWLHAKDPFIAFAERTWARLLQSSDAAAS